MSVLTTLLCVVALAPAAFGRSTFGPAGVPELSREGRQLTAQVSMSCKDAGHTGVFGRCGGGGAPLKCCISLNGTQQKCVKHRSNEWICANNPAGKDWVRQTWSGSGKTPGYYNKSSSPSKKPSKNVAADKPPPPSPKSTPSRSNVAFDIGLPPSGGGSYNRVGGQKQALGTFFNGVGSPFGGCGTMASQLFDDNGKPLPFIALNFQDSSVSAPYTQPATGGSIGAFENGANCGRWIEITVGDNCKGGKNTDTGVCIGGDYVSDEHSGRTIYGLVADSCGDNNYWCRTDKDHLDISAPYLDSLGMRDGWNGRKVSWSFIDDTAPGWKGTDGLEFTWKSQSKWIRNAKGFYADIIVSNTNNGLGVVEQDMGGGNWVRLSTNNWLGQQVSLEKPGDYESYTGSQTRSITLRLSDKSGRSYGTYRVVMNCDSGDKCSDQTRAPAIRL